MNATQKAIEINGFKFGVAPRDQGQMVERSWATVGIGFVLRIADGSDRSVAYWFYPLSKEAETTEWEFLACNGSPLQQGLATKDGARELSEEEAARLLAD